MTDITKRIYNDQTARDMPFTVVEYIQMHEFAQNLIGELMEAGKSGVPSQVVIDMNQQKLDEIYGPFTKRIEVCGRNITVRPGGGFYKESLN